MQLRILFIEDSTDDVELSLRELRRSGHEIEYDRVETSAAMQAALERQAWDLILCDFSMPQFSAPQALEQLKASGLDLPFIIVSGTIGEETAVTAMKAGAHDFLVKGSLARLNPAILRELKDADERRERKRAETALVQQLSRLSTLRTIHTAIASSLDLRVTLKIVLENVTAALKTDAASVLLMRRGSGRLEFAAGHGFRTRAVESSSLRLGQGLAGRAAYERRLIQTENLGASPDEFVPSQLFAGENFVSYFCAPLMAKGEVKGVLETFHRSALHPDPDWLNFLETLADQTAIAIDNLILFEDLQHSNVDLALAYDQTLEGWSHALDLRDKETEGHTLRVTDTTLTLARAMAVNESDLVHMRRGALLHDIGKMGVPDSILLKPGKLTAEEWEVMRRHPQHAYDMLAKISYLRPALDIPFSHHEKWDGTGYPRGLSSEHIPLAARIFSVVDVWDALTNDRPYRPAWSEAEALNYIQEQSGKHFDARIVDAFMRVIIGK
ncbi:MAG TPA: HD domain-containing phosphohydrolase [Anaerolineales bacterium]|jgi:putative nucleotidyltransferase with HDIG domain